VSFAKAADADGNFFRLSAPLRTARFVKSTDGRWNRLKRSPYRLRIVLAIRIAVRVPSRARLAVALGRAWF